MGKYVNFAIVFHQDAMFTFSEIVNILNPIEKNVTTASSQVGELLFDSRRLTVPENSLFFAIKTQKNDGHQFIEELIQKGVRNFVVTENIHQFGKHFPTCNFLQVENAVTAMQKLSAAHRRKFAIPVVGITGSNGKTIVKEWLATMLTDKYDVVRNPNSYNSQIGVPYSVWQMSPRHSLAIFEAGISQPGEMEVLEEVIRPTIGILTNIGSAHDQFFANRQEKLTEKLKLFRRCDILIYNADTPSLVSLLGNPEYRHLKKISWGLSDKSFYKIGKKQQGDGFTRIEIEGNNIEIPFTDAASIENAMHCITLMLYLGYSYSLINNKLSHLSAIDRRMEIKEAEHQSIIINDTYSLDFNSLKIAIDFLNLQKQYPHKTLILSDFEQAGTFSETQYKEIVSLLKNNHISKFIAVGEDFYANRHYFETEKESFSAFFFKKTTDLLQNLSKIEFSQEAILIKGARVYRFERVAEQLQLKTHQTVMNVSLPAIVHNLNYYRSLLPAGCKMVAMVKALSYGLGDAELINELQYHNIDYLAVAYGDEGVNLRKRNIKTPIIVLGAEAHSFDLMIQHNLEPEIFNFHYLRKLEETLTHYPEVDEFKIHIKLDTGMHRLGFDIEDLPELLKELWKNPKLRVASVFSHLAAAEDPAEDAFTRQQIALFDKMSQRLAAALPYPVLRHILNSAGISRFPEASFDMVRLGIGLYGFSGVPADQRHLQNTATLKTILTQIKNIPKGESIGYNRSAILERDSKIGIIPIGYADGFFREFANGRGHVFLNGRRVPIIGKVCMDMCMVDLTDVPAQIGDTVIVYGEENPIDEMAARIGKIPYELLTSVSRRVPRIYVME